MSKPQPNLNLTSTQRLGFTRNYFTTTTTIHHHPTHHTNSKSAIYQLDFDETLKVGFWEHLEHIPNVKLAFVQTRLVHIRNISDVSGWILAKL